MHDITCTGTTEHLTCANAPVHDIHWAVIFTLGMFYIAATFIVVILLADRRRNGKPKRLGYGDQVSIAMKNGDVLTGYVRSATSNGPGVTILCSKDPA